jgi:glycosyltransferase involved in cell wall biosynthesis
MRLLTFSTLFPDSARPNFGVFVENRLRHLVGTGAATSTVLAPVPWFPSRAPRFGKFAQMAAVPPMEQRNGLLVHHPRYPVIPRIGMSAAPVLLYLAARRALARLIRDGLEFDLIDSHYLYPDGVAAVWLGRHFNKPVTMTARGSDVTELPDHAIPRAYIQRAITGADAIISVSAGLKAGLVALGAPPDKVTVLRNGINLTTFRPPEDRDADRVAFGMTGPTLVSVGGLIPRKRHDLAITAMALLPDWQLLIAGEGESRAALEAQISAAGLAPRVRLLGPLPHAELHRLYGAADASVLVSSREGWANVLLESMACGTPALASDIPGNPEVVQSRDAGLILRENTPQGLADAVRDLAANPPDRAATRAYAERFGWDETSAGQMRVFEKAITAHARKSDAR